MQSGVSQGSIMSPSLYVVITFDMSTTEVITIGPFAEDTAIFAA